MADQTDSPPDWWTDVAVHLGALTGLAIGHPGRGLQNALNGNYHSDGGDTQAGLSQWVHDHPPGPAPK